MQLRKKILQYSHIQTTESDPSQRHWNVMSFNYRSNRGDSMVAGMTMTDQTTEPKPIDQLLFLFVSIFNFHSIHKLVIPPRKLINLITQQYRFDSKKNFDSTSTHFSIYILNIYNLDSHSLLWYSKLSIN